MANSNGVVVVDGAVSVDSVKGRMQAVIKELDEYRDRYTLNIKELELEKARRTEADSEVTALHRKIGQMEDEYEQLAQRFQSTVEKYEETVKVADECEKQRRILDHRRNIDEDRLAGLEQMVRETGEAAMESERKYEEVSRKLLLTETDLEKAESKTESSELKAKHLQEDMHSLTNKLKAMQVKVEKASEREDTYEAGIAELQARLKNAESRANESDKLVAKLQRDVDVLQDELLQTKLQYQSLRDEMEPFGREIRAK